MIFGNLQAGLSKEAYAHVLVRAIERLQELDPASMTHGRYPIDDDMFLLFNEVTTSPKDINKPEVHAQYLDIQCMFKGQELIGWYPDDGQGVIDSDFMEERDIKYYQERNDVCEHMLHLTPGTYAIFFPEDVHRPMCMVDQPEDIVKVVIKIKMSALAA